MAPYITLEEHFMLPHLAEAMCNKEDMSMRHPGVDLVFTMYVKDKLLDVDTMRLADMDAGTVEKQVLSHAPISLPNEPTTETCAAANDAVAAAVDSHPTRFAGFAWLNMREPEKAAAELRARVSQGFLGAFLDDHTPDGRKYDDPFFWPVFEAAQDLDVPVYIHPSFAPSPQELCSDPQMPATNVYAGNYTEFVAGFLSCAALSWHSETALHVLRLYASGLFEKFPRLKLVLGHDGEGLPYFLDRITHGARLWPLGAEGATQTRSLRTVWDENIWVTTSGMFGLGPMACMLRNVKPDRIMLSVDYPFSASTQGKEMIQKMVAEGMVTPEQADMIGSGNAKKLLKL